MCKAKVAEGHTYSWKCLVVTPYGWLTLLSLVSTRVFRIGREQCFYCWARNDAINWNWRVVYICMCRHTHICSYIWTTESQLLWLRHLQGGRPMGTEANEEIAYSLIPSPLLPSPRPPIRLIGWNGQHKVIPLCVKCIIISLSCDINSMFNRCLNDTTPM